MAVHAFDIDSHKQLHHQDVEDKLEANADILEGIEKQYFPDKKNVASFRKQKQELASCVNVWWHFVVKSLLSWGLSSYEQDWIRRILLPTVYWHEQMNKTKNPWRRARYKAAWKNALQHWQTHPLTALNTQDIEKYQQWATWVVGHFHRSSSAVEGRNGTLSQIYHTRRGLTPARLKALTAFFNYERRGFDEKTAAERLFETSFPDMFEWMLGEMGALPLPRQRIKRRNAKLLNLQTVPA